jgi:hypothetical protein
MAATFTATFDFGAGKGRIVFKRQPANIDMKQAFESGNEESFAAYIASRVEKIDELCDYKADPITVDRIRRRDLLDVEYLAIVTACSEGTSRPLAKEALAKLFVISE